VFLATLTLLYTGNEAPIPVLVHTLGAAKNKVAAMLVVARATKQAGLAPPSGGALPMMLYETECAEPWGSFQPAALAGRGDSFAYQDSYTNAAWWQYVCTLIPKSPAAVGSERLTPSNVPVLAFNGAGDPIDQPRNMAGIKSVFPDGLSITLPAQGHDVNTTSWGPCAGTLTGTFVAQASVAHLNTSCMSSVLVLTPAFDLSLQDLASGG
jgi:hypothetical protein